MMYRPIGDYALISDCHSTALVSSEGSIDWACLRRFDAGSAFARLLDHDRGGYFSIVPVGRVVASSRRYLDDTMVLETTLVVDTGTIVITDAFAMRSGGSRKPFNSLVRSVTCTDGQVGVTVTIAPRFDYGSAHPWLRMHSHNVVSAVAGDDALVLHANTVLTIDAEACCVHATPTLAAGDSFVVIATSQAAHSLDTKPIEPTSDRLADTIRWWQRWSESTVAKGPYAKLLNRSALVLKALCCAPTGAIIAAPTTSLPEVAGGKANWDYRYCWIRDATLTLAALSAVGHHEVADGFRNFLMRSTAGHGDELQIMYGVYGERRLPEIEVELEGWRRSAPVRIGNGAAAQTQLDMYGHILDAVHLWHGGRHDIDTDEWAFIASLVDLAAQRWDRTDAGIWEIRGEPRHFVHSKVMCWVALDRGIRLAEDHRLDVDGVGDLQAWTKARAAIREAVEADGVDPVAGNFVQYFGTSEVDASLLQLALVGFVEPADPRMIRTVEAIQARLGGADGFIRRYRSTDVVVETVNGGDEGYFLLCSCWLVQVLAKQGRHTEATVLFERIVALGNDVGLYAEEYDVTSKEFLGNFPQAFTHLGLMAAANCLDACAPIRSVPITM